MNKLEKLRKELLKIENEIESSREKRKDLLEKIEKEEILEIKKFQKERGLSHEDVINLLKTNMDNVSM